MRVVESVKNFMNGPSRDHIAEANGQEAIDEHALIKANNERQAQVDHAERLQAMGSPLATAARQALDLENSNKSADAVVFEEPAKDEDPANIGDDLEVAEQSTDVNVYHLPKGSDKVEDPEHKLVA